jgi:glycosyltransferase involved in cell wall biosynthesis
MCREDPLVTVVIPAYNAERWIDRSLASALAQTYRHIEIIVVNDGSTDRTVSLVEGAALRDPRIRLVSTPNQGLAATRNVGISHARGDLIAPLDADDLWHPEKIARQVHVMKSSSPKVGLVYCWAVEIDEDDFIIPPVRNGPTAEGKVLTDVVANAGIITSGANPLIRRSYLDAIGGYDKNFRYCEDWKLQVCLAEICEFAIVPAHLVGYRRTAGSLSKNVSQMARSMESISDWITERWLEMPREIERRMIYSRCVYLAHLSLTNNQFADAIRYKLKSLKVRPQALARRDTAEFGLRLLARMLGIRRHHFLSQTTLVAFKDLALMH